MSGYSFLSQVRYDEFLQIEGRYTGQKLYINGEVVAETANGARVITLRMRDYISTGYIGVYAGDGYWDNLMIVRDESHLRGGFFYRDTPSRVVVRHWQTNLSWDNRVAHAGLDRGVLYLDEGSVSWPGLTAVTEPIDSVPPKAIYQDGQVVSLLPYPFSVGGEIEAFNIPREARSYLGMDTMYDGFYGLGSSPRPFGLSYRTGIVNNEQGTDYGYHIHIWYKVLGEPIEDAYATLNADSDLSSLSWSYKAIPTASITGVRYSKFQLDSTRIAPYKMAILESILYGYDNNAARLPTPDEIILILAAD